MSLTLYALSTAPLLGLAILAILGRPSAEQEQSARDERSIAPLPPIADPRAAEPHQGRRPAA